MSSLTAFDWALMIVPLLLALVGVRLGAVWVLLSPLPRFVAAFVLTLFAMLTTVVILARSGFFQLFNAMLPDSWGLEPYALRSLGMVVFVAYLGMFLHGLGRIRERAHAWTLRAEGRNRINRGLGVPAGFVAGAMVCLALPIPGAMVLKSVAGPQALPAVHQSRLLPRAQRGLVAIVRWSLPAAQRGAI